MKRVRVVIFKKFDIKPVCRQFEKYLPSFNIKGWPRSMVDRQIHVETLNYKLGIRGYRILGHDVKFDSTLLNNSPSFCEYQFTRCNRLRNETIGSRYWIWIQNSTFFIEKRSLVTFCFGSIASNRITAPKNSHGEMGQDRAGKSTDRIQCKNKWILLSRMIRLSRGEWMEKIIGVRLYQSSRFRR